MNRVLSISDSRSPVREIGSSAFSTDQRRLSTNSSLPVRLRSLVTLPKLHQRVKWTSFVLASSPRKLRLKVPLTQRIENRVVFGIKEDCGTRVRFQSNASLNIREQIDRRVGGSRERDFQKILTWSLTFIHH